MTQSHYSEPVMELVNDLDRLTSQVQSLLIAINTIDEIESLNAIDMSNVLWIAEERVGEIKSKQNVLFGKLMEVGL